MARKLDIIAAERRKPVQARAADTVETIFEATARIIERDGPGALTTNRIAERAGVAIGTLYGYFPNKQAILLAMARRDLERIQHNIRTALATPGPSAEVGRLAIRALIQGFGGRKRVRRVLLSTIMAHDRYEELAQPVEALAQRLLTGAGERLVPGTMTETQAFVLTRALVGVVRAVAFEDSPLMGTQALEDELVRLARCYVAGLDKNW